MYELTVFDIAGTTVEEGAAVYRALSEAVDAAGAEVRPVDVEERKGRDKRTALRELLALGGADAGDDAVEAAFDEFRRRLAGAYAHTPPTAMPGVPELLSDLRRAGVRVAVTTGFTRPIAEEVLAAAGLWRGEHVDAVITTDDVPAGRPAPYLIHRAMEATGVADVQAVISVGDTAADVASARNAGVAAVAVLSGGSPRETLAAEGPDHLLDDAAALRPILLPEGRGGSPREG